MVGHQGRGLLPLVGRRTRLKGIVSTALVDSQVEGTGTDIARLGRAWNRGILVLPFVDLRVGPSWQLERGQLSA